MLAAMALAHSAASGVASDVASEVASDAVEVLGDGKILHVGQLLLGIEYRKGCLDQGSVESETHSEIAGPNQPYQEAPML